MLVTALAVMLTCAEPRDDVSVAVATAIAIEQERSRWATPQEQQPRLISPTVAPPILVARPPHYDVFMFSLRQGCPWCVKMHPVLERFRQRHDCRFITLYPYTVPPGCKVNSWPASYPYTTVYRDGKLLGEWQGYVPDIEYRLENAP